MQIFITSKLLFGQHQYAHCAKNVRWWLRICLDLRFLVHFRLYNILGVITHGSGPASAGKSVSYATYDSVALKSRRTTSARRPIAVVSAFNLDGGVNLIWGKLPCAVLARRKNSVRGVYRHGIINSHMGNKEISITGVWYRIRNKQI